MFIFYFFLRQQPKLKLNLGWNCLHSLFEETKGQLLSRQRARRVKRAESQRTDGKPPIPSSARVNLSFFLEEAQRGYVLASENFDLIMIPPPPPRLVLVSWVMDLDDLEKKAATSKAKVLLLSHMRSKASLFSSIYIDL